MLFSKISNEKNQLGIYWGKDAFSLVESTKGQLDKVAQLRFDAPLAGDQGQKIPDSIRFTALLQQAIREKKLISKKANLTLSSKDVIYRSFVIPFMQPAEVKNVVDFEATKYIPIKLEDLSYTYHAIPFNEGEQKNLRILFVAARKNIVERYTGILQQAGLETDFIEPASVSLVRLLQKQGHIPRQQATGIIEIESDGGRITVTDKDVIQFVREFQSPIEGNATPAENAKFFNDLRVSLNFYQRQNPQGKLDRLTIISENDLSALATGLANEFKIPASSLTIQKILKSASPNDLGVLSASGASLRDTAFSSKNFDLKPRTRTGKGTFEAGGIFADWNIKILAISVCASIAAIFGMFTLTANLTLQNKNKSIDLTKKLAIYESSTIDKLNELKNNSATKLNQYKDVRTTSEIIAYLKKIPTFLPKGAWLNDLSIEYFETPENTADGMRRVTKISIGIDGNVYLPNPDEQIRQINTMVAQMKNDKNFMKSFANVTLSNVKKESVNNYPVTHFRITCK